MVDTSVKPAFGIVCAVPDRSAAALLPIIQQNVAPGTTMWSDEWTTYNTVSSLPNVAQHDTVNHSIEFVNPTTGMHTRNVESYWNRQKIKLKRMKGVVFSEIFSYLSQFMVGGTSRAVFDNICAYNAQQYPV